MKTEAETKKTMEDLRWYLHNGEPDEQTQNNILGAVAALDWILGTNAIEGNPINETLKNIKYMKKLLHDPNLN